MTFRIFGRYEAEDSAKQYTVQEATVFIQKVASNPGYLDHDNALDNEMLISNILAGIPDARRKGTGLIRALLEHFKVNITDQAYETAVYEIYKNTWGLGPIDELYHEGINSIQVNGPRKGQTSIMRALKNERTDIEWVGNDQIKLLVDKLIAHDRGASFNRSDPSVESVRKDGTRITATCPPATPYVTLIIRKQTPRVVTPEEMIEMGEMDEMVWFTLKKLVQGRANILISGGTGSGKTTLLRTLFAAIDKMLRSVSIESDGELFFNELFPERNHTAMEIHPEAKFSGPVAIKTALRSDPEVIIWGEFRGEEVEEVIRAFSMGSPGSMATAHFSSPRESIEGTGRMMLAAGVKDSLENAAYEVAKAFNVVVQMFADRTKGIIKIERITEVMAENGEIHYRDLVRWMPNGQDYLDGSWRFVQPPSQDLLDRMFKYGVTGDVFEPEPTERFR